MNRLCCLLVPAVLAIAGCTFDVGPRPLPDPDERPAPPPSGPPAPRPASKPPPKKGPPLKTGHRVPGKYGHLPQRMSFSPKASVQLKEGCYSGDFVLGSSQIRVTGAGVGKTVIHGNLVIQTQCVVSNVTVLGDVIFEGHQAELVDSDFFGRIIDNGMQNRY